MNFKTTLILLVVLLGAATAYLFVQRSQKPPTTPEDTTTLTQGRKLFDAAPGDVTSISIADQTGARTVIARDPADFKKWVITQPIHAPANTSTVESFVRDFLAARSSSQLDDNATTGLDKPRYHVELATSGADAKPIVVDVGSLNAVGDAVFVKVAGADKVDEVPPALVDQFGKKLEDWRDKHLLSLSVGDVKQVQIDRAAMGPGKPGGRLDLAHPGTSWEITGPKPMPADQTAVDSLVSSIVYLEATDFVKPGSAVLKFTELDHPRLTVRFSTASPTTSPSTNVPATQPTLGGTTITFGGYDDVRKQNVYARVSNSPEVVKVAASTLASFEKSALDLRNKDAVDIDPAKVSEFSIEVDHPATTQPTTKPAEERTIAVARRKESLILGPMLPAMPALPAGTAPAGPSTAPAMVPATVPSAPALPATLPTSNPVGAAGSGAWPSPLLALAGELAATDSGTQPATQPTASPVAVPVSEPATAPTATGPTVSAAATQPTTTQPAAVAATPVPASQPALPAVPPPPPSKWVLASETGISADDDQVRELLDALHPLKAEKFIETAPATQPSANYVLKIKTVAAGGDTANYELRITDPGGEAKLIAQYNDLTFELDRSLLKKLNGDFKTRHPPEPAAAPPSFPGHGGFPGGFTPGGG